MTETIVTVKQGQLKGLIDTDLNGDNYFKFLGIPYAKPPIGPLRFKAPVPAEPWSGVRDATKEGSPCLALDLLTWKTIIGSEDCLYLNVFTKELPKPGLSPKPVMVFIHGGGFTMGSGSEQMQGGKYLVAEDVVLVVINYRLGIFGFLSSDDISLEIPGNAGLKDQTFALKWIKENIASFNGDPNNVTIFGVSAGGASVHFQVLSPTAKGLFDKAIAQSGLAICPWAWGQKNAIQVAEKLGKKVPNDKEALEVLMDASSDEIIQAAFKIPDVLLDAKQRRPFGPVIEYPNPTAFLTENPIDLLSSGKFNQVPLIQGITSNEGAISEFKKEIISKDVDFTKGGSIWTWDLEKSSPQYAKLQYLSDFYFKDGDTIEAKCKFVGDVGFLSELIESTKLTVKTSHSPVYLYVFDYEVAMSKLVHKFMGIDDTDNFKGVAHGGDQMFLLSGTLGNNMPLPPDFDPKIMEFMTAELQGGVRQVTKMWADFARTGRPHKQWEPVTNVNDLKYFEISKNPQLKVGLYPERVAFWKNILEGVSFNPRLQEKPIV